MVKRRLCLISEKGKGEGYRNYPSPGCGLGSSQLPKRYFIDTTDFGFDQGSFSIGEGVSVASSGAMSSVWACEAVGARVCFGLFRRVC